MDLGILDQSPIREGGEARDAVAETLELAQAADAMGYSRYWVAEHHNTRSFAGSCPEILMGRLASLTKTLRIGCAGILMQHYAPLKVAEQFRMLETLFPGRIDLGLGRAPGSDARTAAALQPGPTAFGPDVYPQKVDLLIRLLEDARGHEAITEDHPYRGIHAEPRGPGRPDIWLLGSGPSSAAIAASLGQAFAYAHFISGDDGDGGIPGSEIIAGYERRFLPRVDGSGGSQPARASVAVSVVCGETDEQAEFLALTRHHWVMKLMSGEHSGFRSPGEIAEMDLTSREKGLMELSKRRCVVGGPETVRRALMDLAARYGTDSLILHTFLYDPAARLRCYELIADALL